MPNTILQGPASTASSMLLFRSIHQIFPRHNVWDEEYGQVSILACCAYTRVPSSSLAIYGSGSQVLLVMLLSGAD